MCVRILVAGVSSKGSKPNLKSENISFATTTPLVAKSIVDFGTNMFQKLELVA